MAAGLVESTVATSSSHCAAIHFIVPSFVLDIASYFPEPTAFKTFACWSADTVVLTL